LSRDRRQAIGARFGRSSHALFAAAIAMSATGCSTILGIESDPQLNVVASPGTGKCTAGTIYVAIASDFSATATDIAIPYFFGTYDYLRKINENGGLRGCPIDIQVADNKYDPAATDMVVNNWRTTDPNYDKINTMFIFGTGPTTQVATSVMAEKKVIIPGSYAGRFTSPVPVTKDVSYPVVNEAFTQADFTEQETTGGYPYVFYPATDYSTGIRVAIRAAWKIQPGRMAFAHDTANNCAYCVDPLAAGKSFLGSLQGMSIGRDLTIPQTSATTDEPAIASAVATYFDKEIAQVLADSTYHPVSWVWSGNSVYASSILGKYLAVAQQTIASNAQIPQAVKDTWHLRLMANNWGIGETTPDICGAACNNDVFYGLFPVPHYGDLGNSSGMTALIALHDEYAMEDSAPVSIAGPSGPSQIPARTPEDYRDVRYVQGYASALLWRRAIEAAIDAGHSDPTGDDIKTALEKFDNVDLEGMTAGPISFSETDHRPQSTESIYQLDSNGTLAFVDRFTIALIPDWLGY
jgi:ABC-type branched-subunit amino acid transport system substrate-binding protein